MGGFIDLTGQRFGKLTVLSYTKTLTGLPGWVCRCDCGTLKIVNGQHLRVGISKSCGCAIGNNLQVEYEGRTMSMKELSEMCGIDRRTLYARYYVYGMALEDATTEPIKYKPHKLYEYKGEKHNLSEWARMYGMPDYVLRGRIKSGWAFDKAISTPVGAEKGRKFKKPFSERLIEHNGKKRLVTEWARIYGIEPDVLYRRLNAGWSFDKAVNTPVKAYKCKNRAEPTQDCP